MFHDGQGIGQTWWWDLAAIAPNDGIDDWVPSDVRDANEWLRALEEVEPNNLRWRRRVEAALKCMRDGLLQKDLELGALANWERECLAGQVSGLRVRLRAALVKIGVLLAGLTSLHPRDVEHGLSRVGADVSAFLEAEADAYLRLEVAQEAPMQALRRAKVGT